MDIFQTNTTQAIYTGNNSGQTYVGENYINILRNNNDLKTGFQINFGEENNIYTTIPVQQFRQISFEDKAELKFDRLRHIHTNILSNYYNQNIDDPSNVSIFENVYDYYIKFKNVYNNRNQIIGIPAHNLQSATKSNALSFKALQKIKYLSRISKLKSSDVVYKLSTIKAERKNKLNESLKKEVSRIESRINTKTSQLVIDEVTYIFDLVSDLPFDNAAVELSKNNSFKLTLVFPNNKMLMLSKSFDTSSETGMKDDVLYSFFINRILVASDVTNIQTYIKSFKGYISN